MLAKAALLRENSRLQKEKSALLQQRTDLETEVEYLKKRPGAELLNTAMWCVISLALGAVVSWVGIPSLQDMKWSNDKLIVKSVGTSYPNDVFSFPVDFVNTGRFTINNVGIVLMPRSRFVYNVAQVFTQRVRDLPPMESTPITLRNTILHVMGPPESNGRYGMGVTLTGTYGCCLWWHQKFTRQFYFVGDYDEYNKEIHWWEQSPFPTP